MTDPALAQGARQLERLHDLARTLVVGELQHLPGAAGGVQLGEGTAERKPVVGEVAHRSLQARERIVGTLVARGAQAEDLHVETGTLLGQQLGDDERLRAPREDLCDISDAHHATTLCSWTATVSSS